MAIHRSNQQVPEPRSSVIQWLLDSDPSIRWRVMRDLIGAPADEVAAERAKVATEKVLQKKIHQLDTMKPNLTKITQVADEYGKDQDAATDLWRQGGAYSRLLSLLILDLKAIDSR
jgi:hypothetical protein